MLTLTDYTIEKTGFSWVVTIPYDETVPQLKQDEYNLDPIMIVEESDEGDNYIKLEVHQCLVSDNGEYILFFCHAWKEQHEEEHEVKSKRGGWRNGGRPSIEGKERRWIIPQDILDIIDEKGKNYIWEAVRFKYKLDSM